jgi:hypothetical protein
LSLSLRYKIRARDLQEKLEGYKRNMIKVRQLWNVLAPRFIKKPIEPVEKEVLPEYKVVEGDKVDELMA